MTSFDLARPGVIARLAASALALILAACGGGGVSGPPPVNDPNRITILPDTAILYSGIPTTFTISGGTGSYIVSSSNQAVVQASGPLTRGSLTVVPSAVVDETVVTLTVRDTGTAPVATATLTVRPGTVANDIVVTPTGTQGGGCAPAVCSGGDAIVSATISQAGIPLADRAVRLSVVSGDFRFITSPPGLPEVLETSTVVVSDQAGAVHARIRVLAGAPNQTGVVQVTDTASGAFRRGTFLIAQATGSAPGFFAVPDTITFSGPNDQQCASSGRADVYIFGGLPPYSVGSAGAAFVTNRSVVSTSGGSFGISPTGICVESLPIAIVDSAGRTTLVTLSNVLGEVAIPPLLVSPSTVTLSDCTSRALVTVAGGTGTFTASSGSGAIYALPNTTERLIGIGRVFGTAATTPLSVGVASGPLSATITVNLTGQALTTLCDGAALTVTPPDVLLTTCNAVNLTVSGGTPPYAASVNNSIVTATFTSSNVLSIRRSTGAGPNVDWNAIVVVRDAAGVNFQVDVNGTGGANGTCVATQ